MTLSAGTRLGRYEIRAPLGKGGMGEVYRAHDPQLGRDVALKILPVDVASDAERMRRFAQEAKAASALNHPNILTIYEVGGADPARFIAAEFVDGVTLRERLAAGPIELDEALDIALQAASALAAAHAAGIVHRDVKPENLMIRPDGWVKVLDFGLAKLAPPAAELGDAPTQTGLATEAGVVMGTARYMSPEQACGLAVDARTDVWSLGVVLYEMIAGRLPFPGTTSGEVLAAVLQQPDPLPLARFTPNVPPDLERFVSRALARKREERYQAMHDLALDLKGLKQRREFEREARRSSSSASSAGSPPASDPVGLAEAAPSSRPVRRRRRLSLAVATGGLAAAILAGVLYLRPSGSASATVESLAVLPLAVAGGDSDTEFLSEGLAENMINSLSQVPGLKVIARSSAFRYQGSEVDPRQAGRELGVHAVVTGRLAQRGERLSLSIELMDVREDRHLWGRQYDRPLPDLLDVQHEISRDIAAQLRRLTPDAKERIGRRYTENVEAYRLYLKGRHYWYKFPRPEYDKSREYFEQAIDLDPSYALAYAGLADYYGLATGAGRWHPDEGWPKAEAATRKALELDNSLAEAHHGLAAQKLILHRDWQGAEAEFGRAIELNPSFAEVHRLYSRMLAYMGRWEEARAHQRRLLELDPLSAPYRRHVADVLYAERRYDEAITEIREALELDPDDPRGNELLGDALERSGRHQEAVAAWRQALVLAGDQELVEILDRSFATSGFAGAVEALARARLQRLEAKAARGDYVPAMDFVRLHLRLGNREPAFEWLAKAERERTTALLRAGTDPAFDPLRGDPRFEGLLDRVGIPAAARPALEQRSEAPR